MSHYNKLKTKLTNKCSLIKALIKKGYKEHQIEDHEIATELYGYQGDKRKEKANIIIRRKDVGSSSNDIGFVAKADGSYEAIISDYDKSIGYDDKWLNEINMNHSIEQAKNAFEVNGWSYVESMNSNGEYQLVGETY